MGQISADTRTKILDHLRTLAPFSIIDNGLILADNGRVAESSKEGPWIRGVVRDEGDASYRTDLHVLSAHSVEARCSCSSSEEMNEQWCPHAVALLIRSCDLGFFDPHAGFAVTEAVYRMNTSSPAEIASALREVCQPENRAAAPAIAKHTPSVEIFLEMKGDRVGVQVCFDKEPQGPVLFEGFKTLSSRALDNILIQLLDDLGSWDEERRFWFVSASNDIEVVLGLVQEYSQIFIAGSKAKVLFGQDILDARLQIKWRDTGADLSMVWIKSDGSAARRDGDLLGTGPYWTVIDRAIYRISPLASRIASIFPYSSRIALARSQVGPLLEVLNSLGGDSRFVEIIDPELQPKTKVKTPTPVLEVERREAFDHFSSQRSLDLSATLEFEYPTPPESDNLVYLPDREVEAKNIEYLKSLGFTFHPERKKHSISGDAAFDLVHRSEELFPSPWRVNGLAAVKKGIRFAELNLNVTVSSPGEKSSETEGTGKIDWFDCHVSLTQNNANIPLSTLFKNASVQSDKWIRLDSGAFAKVPGGGLNQLKTTLGMLDPNFRLSNAIKARLSVAQAIGFSRVEDEQFSVTLDKRLKTLSKKLIDFTRIGTISAPKNFRGKLRSYQTEGLSWLSFLHEFELCGILADEMGLGKTVQTLALIQHLKDSRGKDRKLGRPSLVVAPTSLIMNWSYEAKRFTPKLKVLLLHGPQRKSHFSEIPDYDLIVTSYALLRLDRYELERHRYGYLILDEAQNIKNYQAATTKAAKALRADHRLALSGTPTENRPMELWSIMDFLMPGYLGSSEFFRTYIEKPILESGTDAPVINFLRSKTRPFILRRTKAEVEKDLPPKVESTLHVEMTPSQQELYAAVLEEVRPKVFEAVAKKGVRGASVSILAALLRLRQICNHPNSIDALKELPGYDSGKFTLLQELIEEALGSGRKILVFCQFREMLSIIRRWLDETKVNYQYLDGASVQRQDIVDKFNNDPEVRLFLISLKAGGTGLNLTAADTVIIYDPWWNPAVEHQAVDRAHRIGQTKTVSVYRLVTENSIEQKIMALKSRKGQIVDALVNETGLSSLTLSRTELDDLFKPFPADE